MIPTDFEKADFLKKFRRVVNEFTNVVIIKATCHDEPHKRFKPKPNLRRERHKHTAFLASATFAHRQVCDEFYKRHGARISISFKLHGFVGNLMYLTEPGKKASTDLDLQPATFPADLNWKEELQSNKAGEKTKNGGNQKEEKKRKRLTFDEVSNIVLEGIGNGPIRSRRGLEEAAKKLKMEEGKVELWNYLGEQVKSPSDVTALVCRVWRLAGIVEHPLFYKTSEYDVKQFDLNGLKKIAAWRNGGYKGQVLILSSLGGLGKTGLAEALAFEVSPGGFWFVDDPDDFRLLDGEIEPGQAIVIDEVSVANMPVNEVKKLFDTLKTRRIKCRHFNGTKPGGCPVILTTNSPESKFFPDFECHGDETGVYRRKLFEAIKRDLRVRAAETSKPSEKADEEPTEDGDWQAALKAKMVQARVASYSQAAVRVAEGLGVAFQTELAEAAPEIAKKLSMKTLEQKRFLQSFATVAAQGAAAPSGSGKATRKAPAPNGMDDDNGSAPFQQSDTD